jgi:hypothetical protein
VVGSLLVAAYLALTALTMVVWSARDAYPVTGDEPHYLVLAQALIRDGTFDVAAAYRAEFADPAIYLPGLAPADAPLAPPAAHVVMADAGVFSWHGPGVALLVSVPFALAGVSGAKVLLAALGALVVVVTWRLSGVFLSTVGHRAAATAALCLAYPLLPAATQVYPDLLAGLLMLAVLYLLATPAVRRGNAALAGYALLAGALPWLGMKFAPAAAILLVALGWRERQRLWALAPAAVPIVLLVAHNVLLFGSLLGPPTDGTLALTDATPMIGWGLLVDQNQGFLLQNPILWLAVPGLVVLARRSRGLVVVLALVFASVWVPAALHPGWYGLGSFVGRYSWPLALLAVLPALAGLGWLADRSRRAFAVVVGLGLAANAFVFGWVTLGGAAAPGQPAGFDLYSKPVGTWLESYALFWFPAQDWLPALYDPDWAYSFAPNAVWLLVPAALALTAVRFRVGMLALIPVAAMIVLAGIVAVPGPRQEAVVIDRTSAAAGYLAGEPIRQMRQGPYTWSVTYRAAPVSGPAGRWEIVRSVDGVVVASGELVGSAGEQRIERIVVPYLSWRPVEYSLRVAGYGSGPITVIETGVQHG